MFSSVGMRFTRGACFQAWSTISVFGGKAPFMADFEYWVSTNISSAGAGAGANRSAVSVSLNSSA